ncbi:putative glutaminyl-trna synthetase [Diplodia seriata]|uniref:glutamine--tRNA ligase n=1 Tax=Diplodia seriata TaxID=420778 RepID=A0A0G2EPC7_9PEZI|nr:putative glutaminyl-trna synthetase [Diplodia seriata]OMP82511.1 putative glutamine--tRNA ligase [Diplodia seriata]
MADAPAPAAPEISKRAAEKARKKAEAAAKKAAAKTEAALRPKPAADSKPANVFEEGWLKRVYNEKPVADVRTRFPPEPNGYLHIGHAKAIAVNFGFAKNYNGVCVLRFDDTNPAKEEEKFFTSIQDMVSWLGFKPHAITYSSDNFDKLYELAEEMIRRDKGYVCHCTREDVNRQRGENKGGDRFACAHRDRPVEESLAEFRAMRDGKYKPGAAHLRMKQSLLDSKEGNPQMWDLAAYRIVEQNHHFRTGDKWKIYPTYDFTHCICDALENITHSLCTTEFQQSRISYDWLLEILDMKVPKSEEKGPMQREYGRLNVEGTILSKRRIAMLVEGCTVEKKNEDGTVATQKVSPAVRGWDDPRLYTLVALRRRGIPAQALLNFVHELGVTDALTSIQAVRLDNAVRKHLERTVPRLSLILDPIKVVIEDVPEDHQEEISVPFDPKKPDGDKRNVPFSRSIYVDRSDFREEADPNFFRLAPGQTVGLLNVGPIKATSFTKDAATGLVNEIRAVKTDPAVKPKGWIHWVDAKTNHRVVARQYNALFRATEPNALDWKTGGYADDLNPDSEIVHKDAVIEKGLDALTAAHSTKPGGGSDDLVRFQAMRTGYFCIDPEREGDAIVLNQIVTLKEDKDK